VQIEGKVLKYGDNINTDEIIPARYLVTISKEELAEHCMEDLDEKFVDKVKEAKILAVGKNFGCGSSREHAPLALKGAGVACIIAVSFARIFFRNCLNMGIPIFECPGVWQEVNEAETVRIDLETGRIENLSQKRSYTVLPYPEFVQQLIDKGGLGEYIKEKIKTDSMVSSC